MSPKVLSVISGAVLFLGALALTAQTIDLPSSKQLNGEIPGHPQRLNSLPISMAVSPDHRYVVTVNAGYGTFESKYEQSLAVLDTQTGKLVDFPDARTTVRKAHQTLYSGLAFSHDGRHIYATMGSITGASLQHEGDTGNGIVVYSFNAGNVAPERFIPIPLQQLAAGRKTRVIDQMDSDKGVPFPAAIALVGDNLLVADNLSDDVLLIDPASGQILHRFDLSESDAVPGTYPVALAVTRDNRRAFVALWNASAIVELNLIRNTIARKLTLLKPSSPIKPGTHPCAFEFSPDQKILYVALANRDAVAAVKVGAGAFAVKAVSYTHLTLPTI